MSPSVMNITPDDSSDSDFSEQHRGSVMPIAVIGLGFRGPGEASSIEGLWSMMKEKREAWSPVPSDRWNHEAFYHPDSNRNGTTNVTGGHFIKQDLSKFEAPFFSMTRAEAEALDPQQRLLLECTYEALENAGASVDKIAGSKTCCFVGSFCGDYTDMLSRDPETMPFYQATSSGHSRAIISNRLSYFFDLRGPSATVDTACSASLVALHLACQSIRAGESKQALVAGANVILSHEMTISMTAMRFLSPDGRCYSFDDRANGYSRGEGVACVFLKPLADALRDNDPIRAVIRNTGTNQDGKTSGITLPSSTAQEDLIRSVYSTANMDPLMTSFVECHGTGTAAGDPVETAALARVFTAGRSSGEFLRIGSVKANIGHLEGASGVAGLIKAILMVERGKILPNRNFEYPSRRIDFENWKLKVPVEVEDFPSHKDRIVSVNSFGYGGSNAHAIVQDVGSFLNSMAAVSAAEKVTSNGHNEPHKLGHNSLNGTTTIHDIETIDLADTGNGPDIGTNGVKFTNGLSTTTNSTGNINGGNTTNGMDTIMANCTANGINTGLASSHKTRERSYTDRTSRIFILSAFNQKTLQHQAEKLADYLSNSNGANLEEEHTLLHNLAYTLSERRTLFPIRSAVHASSIDELLSSLSRPITEKRPSKNATLGFIFTGQGAQWWGMGRELFARFPVFAASISAAEAHLKELGADWGLREEMFKDSETTCVNEVQISQPVCTALQIALVNLMSSWDIRPAAVTGHSSGEIAAAYCAGALTSKDAIAAAYHRGRISELAKQRCTAPGAMMAIGMSEEEATPALNRLESGKVVIACVNSSKSLTVSGDANAIDELEGNLKASGVFARKLAVGVAYHSHHMACVAEEYLSSISHIKALTTTRRLERCAFFSSVTGSLVSDASELGPEYWVKNLLGQVKFEASLQEMCRYAIPRATMDSKKKSGAKRLITALCEIGPHSALAGPTKQVLTAQDQLHKRGISVLSILVRNRDAVATAAGTVCQLSELGFSPSIASFNMRDPASALKYKVLSGLPPYPWNHESSYWAEPRVSKEYRLRPYCRSDILGIPVSHFHPSEPRWRNIVKVTEMPWVKDHKVQGSVVYPAAGYLCMAIEAMANQAHDQSIDVASFELKEVTIGQALVVPEDTGEVEMLLSLRPFSTSIRSPSGVWNEFCISSVSPNNRWTDHSRGLIRVNKAYKPNDVATASQLGAQKEGISEFVAKINESATSSIDPVKFYADLCDLGLDYGPTFSNVRSIRHGVDVAAASIDIADSAAVMPHGFEYPFKLHPSTLDSLFHPLFAARILQPQAAEAAFVPILLDRLVLSAKMRTGPGPQLTTWTRTRAVDNRQLSASSVIFDPAVSVDDPVVQIDGLVCMKLAETEVDGGRIKNTALGHQVSWAADVDAILPSDFEAQCQDLVSDTVEEERIEALEEAGYYLMKRALQSLSDAAIDHAQPHHKRLHNCMSLRVAEHQGRYTSDDAAVDRLLDSVSSSGAEGDLLVHVGRNLVPIIEGQRDALELMLEGGRLDAFYRDHSRFDRNYQQATRYLKLAGHKKPDMSILEIGSGTGGASLPVLKALTNDDTGIHHFGSFAFTDISTGFFEAAKAKLSQWSSVLSYEKLDIEADPLEQGFEAQSYDVILAANVLHATRSMDNTMRNVRKLLKPGGKLVVVELTRERFTTSTIFGTLPGWFAGDEEDRIRGPTLTELQWDTLLRRTGFNGVDMAASDSRFEAHHQGSMIVATASQENSVDDSNTADRRQTGDFLIIHEGGAAEIFYAEKLGSWLLNMGLMVSTSSLDSCQPEDKLCIVLSDLSRPSFDAPTDNRFRKIKAIFTASAGVLWVTSGASFDCTNPTANMATGFARTVRSEYGNNTVVTLDLDPNAKTPSEWGLSIKAIQVLISRHLLQPLESGQSESTDREYAECGGKLIIPRVTPHNSLNRSLKSLLGNAEPEMVPFEQNGQQLVVEVGTPGLLDTITFVNDTRTDAELPAGSVEISVKAAGMNFKDVMMAMGQIAYETLGGECSGIITSVGADVQNLRIGDRVACYSFGTFANRVRQDASAVQVIPDDMPMELAAALPVTFCTAYYSVIHVARIQKGQSVLIHAASGGLGQALIEICQMYGAEVFCTVGTLEKKLLLMDNYGISEERIFTSRDASFASSLMKKTGGKGVDVIMNSVAGEMLRVTWDCIAPFGIFVELGARDYTINTRLEMQKFARNVTFSAVNLVSLIRERPQIASQVWADVMDLFRRKQLKGPTPLTTYGISQLEPALRLMQSGKHLGKLVLVHQDGELVKATSSLSSSLNTLLEEDASYLLVGGMGGLGREIALWMLSQGARNFIFASRSGLAKPEAQSLKTKLEELGARVIVGKCDVSKFSELQALMDQASGLPPVKGVIQGAMVLQDSLLSRMDLSEYEAVVRPKVQGTWNLHNLFRDRDLRFFIMLSSTSGLIGNASQAAYAASSTFLDSFALYRRAHGLAAATIDLGVITDIGYVAENENLARALERQGFEGTSPKELMALLHAVIEQGVAPLADPKGTRLDGLRTGHIMTGLGTWREGAISAFDRAIFSYFRRAGQQDASRGLQQEEDGTAAAMKVRGPLKAAKHITDAVKVVCEGLRAKISSLSMIPVGDISVENPLSDYGMDSLVAVEMRNWIARELDATVPVLELMANEPMHTLSGKVVAKSRLVNLSELD